MAADGGTKAVVAALIANLGIAITKFVAFFLTGHQLDAGRGDPLGGRLRQPGAAAGRRASAPAGPRRHSTRSGTAGSATSTASSSRSCCSASVACSRSTRRTTSTTRSHSGHHEDRGPLVVGAAAGAGRRHRLGEPLLPHRDHARPTRCAARRRTGQFIRRAKPPELPVILLEDFAALLGLVFALLASGSSLLTGQLLLRRGRHRADRRCCWSRWRSSWPSRPRACCWASRPPRRPGRASRRRPHRAGRRSSGLIHLKTLHLGPEELLGGRQDRHRPGRHAPSRSRPGDRRRRGRRSAPPSRPPG